jgi:hypothetical protein
MGSFLKNNMLWIGVVVGAVGLVLSLLAYVFHFGNQPSFLAWYGKLVIYGTPPSETNVNQWVMIVAPLILLTGGWYAGEQLVLRRKFEKLLETPKKSEFLQNKKELEDIAKQLPDGYWARVEMKESEFKSKRAA